MADFNSSIITKTLAVDSGRQSAGLVDGDDVTGVVLMATVNYTLAGTEATSDTIQLVDLPLGAVVLPQNSYCTTSADPGTTLTFNVGDAGSATRYANGIVLSAGGCIPFTNTNIPTAACTQYRIATQTNQRIIATVASAASLTAAVKVTFTIAYRVKA
jgi:hypothetical protein